MSIVVAGIAVSQSLVFVWSFFGVIASLYNPLVPLLRIFNQRFLVKRLCIREIAIRYRGSVLGSLWAFLVPVVMLGLYTLVFGGLFGVSWDGDESAGLAAYAVQLYCGMVVFQIFQECMTRAPLLVTAVPNYVKKVVFPLDILPVPVLGAAMFHGCIGSLVVVAVNAAFNHAFSWTMFLFPLVWVPLIFWCLGIMWWFAALGVYVRDIEHIAGLSAQILFFASPVIYPLSKVPEPFLQILKLNPLTWIVAGQRATLLGSGAIPWWPLLIVGFAGVCLLVSGFAFFQRVRPGFSDII